MSVREARLCDNKNHKDEPCGGFAVGTCFVCDDDICEEHTTNKEGGLIIDLHYLLGNKACDHDGKEPQLNGLVHERRHLCMNCKRAIERAVGLRDLVTRHVEDATHEALKAALVAEAVK